MCAVNDGNIIGACWGRWRGRGSGSGMRRLDVNCGGDLLLALNHVCCELKEGGWRRMKMDERIIMAI